MDGRDGWEDGWIVGDDDGCRECGWMDGGIDGMG